MLVVALPPPSHVVPAWAVGKARHTRASELLQATKSERRNFMALFCRGLGLGNIVCRNDVPIHLVQFED